MAQKKRLRRSAETQSELLQRLSDRIIGQPRAMESIVPYVQMYQAGLCPEGRPAGVFLLVGPTGTGKTRTVEALAEVLHGSARNVLRVDCGEYQLDHEVAKLIGAPPGYLGHRETHPVLTQAKLASATSDHSSLSIVLFDEVEKAAPSLTRLLLGVLDRASLRLGDNNVVNFEHSLIFLTSNVGARGMMQELRPGFGFAAHAGKDAAESAERLEKMGVAAARREFSPEFLNRIDAIITYKPLSEETLELILNQQIELLQRHIEARLGPNAFNLIVPRESRLFLLRQGASTEYGARELKRAVHQHLTQPLAAMVAQGQVKPGAIVRVDLNSAKIALRVRAA
jgi:ATP-dependent Clp protease ATP-binding subunit ClpA